MILWDIASGRPIGKSIADHQTILSIAFSPTGKLVATGSCAYQESHLCRRGEIMFWEVPSAKPLGEPLLYHNNWVTTVAFSPDGNILASGSNDRTITLWDVSTHESIGKPLLGHNDGVSNVAFSPDGKTLASGSHDKTVILWDVETQQIIAHYMGHSTFVESVSFSPDGKMLASSDGSGLIILWDIATGLRVGEPLGLERPGAKVAIAFSPDSKIIATSMGVLWDVNPDFWVQITCQRLGRNFTRAEWTQYFPNEQYRKTCERWPLEPEAIR
jgi:WD40 repeat protein